MLFDEDHAAFRGVLEREVVPHADEWEDAGTFPAHRVFKASGGAGRLQREVADTCLQVHGGTGYIDETWVSSYFRDSRLLSIGGGADDVMLQVLARPDGFTA